MIFFQFFLQIRQIIQWVQKNQLNFSSEAYPQVLQ